VWLTAGLVLLLAVFMIMVCGTPETKFYVKAALYGSTFLTTAGLDCRGSAA
jgi:hypothetical protein